MLDKLHKAFALLKKDVSGLRAEVERISKVKPVARDGRDGKDGVSPDPKAIAKEVSAQVPTPRNGRDGKDGRKGDKGDRGAKGEPGRDGKSITDVKVRNNDLIVSIDGKPRNVGAIRMPAPESFTPALGGRGLVKEIVKDPEFDGSVIFASYFEDQGPTLVSTPHTVLFGDDLIAAGDITLDALGNFTVNVSGRYRFDQNINFGRATNNGVAQLLIRIVVNGVQLGGSGANFFASASDRLTKSTSYMLDLVKDDVMRIQIMRDPAGENDGGLFAQAAAPPFAAVPSATINVRRSTRT